MKCYERQPRETERAFEAFKIFRDMGAERTLKKTGELYYGSATNLRQIQEWSRLNDWVARAQQRDDYVNIIEAQAVERYLRLQAGSLAERHYNLQDKLLANAELAAEQERKMLEWPLEETVEQERSADGTNIVYIKRPAGWNKNTAYRMHVIAQAQAGEREIILSSMGAPSPDESGDNEEQEGGDHTEANTRDTLDPDIREALRTASERRRTGESPPNTPGPLSD